MLYDLITLNMGIHTWEVFYNNAHFFEPLTLLVLLSFAPLSLFNTIRIASSKTLFKPCKIKLRNCIYDLDQTFSRVIS